MLLCGICSAQTKMGSTSGIPRFLIILGAHNANRMTNGLEFDATLACRRAVPTTPACLKTVLYTNKMVRRSLKTTAKVLSFSLLSSSTSRTLLPLKPEEKLLEEEDSTE